MTRKEQLAFIESVAPAAQASQAKNGIPASVIIAQAIDESGWGQSLLAKECNNFFGIKARQGEDYAQYKTRETYKVRLGDTVETIAKKFDMKAADLIALNPSLSDEQRQASVADPIKSGHVLQLVAFGKFRKFKSLAESIAKHGDLLALNARYAPAMAHVDDPLTFALRMKECGYSTDEKYVSKLATLIQSFGLSKYDAMQEAAHA